MKASALNRAHLRVIKTLSPQDRGAIGLTERYGDALLCVRHRTDAAGKVRFVTVELLVDRKPIKPRTDKTVEIRIGFDEHALQTLVRTAGGRWDSRKRLWHLSRSAARILGLKGRIVEK